jgi:DNA polymerase
MTETRDSLRNYLEGRANLGEPEMFLPSGGRREILEKVKRVGSGVTDTTGLGMDAARLARSGTREEILAIQDMEGSDGAADASVLCVGEAPGANEDQTGLPFVGRAGKLLDRLLLSAGFPRAEVFICNVLKCRPPGNRNPLPDEIESCSPFMLRQLELVSPTVIVAFGTFAAQTLLGCRDSLRHLRGRTHLYQGFPLVVTYHPAALLRNPGWTRPTWRDLQLARRIVDGEQGQPTPRMGTDDAAQDSGTDDDTTAQDQLILGGRDG